LDVKQDPDQVAPNPTNVASVDPLGINEPAVPSFFLLLVTSSKILS
jgi:hypothetical protein